MIWQRISAAILGVLLILLTPRETTAQVQLLDDLVRLGAKAGEAANLAGRPASGAVRTARGITLARAAAMTWEKSAATSSAMPGRLRAYLGLEGSTPTVILNGKTISLDNAPLEPQLKTLLTSTAPDTGKISGADLYVETDILSASAFRDLRLPSDIELYLANLDGPSWKVHAIDMVDGRVYRAEVAPSLHIRIDEGSTAVAGYLKLQDMPFRKDDAAVFSFFNRADDPDSFDAILSATQSTHTTIHVVDTADISTLFQKSQGKVVILIGHIEGDSIVLRRPYGDPPMKYKILDLQELANRNNSALFFLGCETAKLPVSGFDGLVQSLDISRQLQNALISKTFSSFVQSLGSPDIPLIIEMSAVGSSQVIIAARVQRTAEQIQRARAAGQTSIVSARIGSRYTGTAYKSGTSILIENIFGTLLAILMLPVILAVALGISLNWWLPTKLLLRFVRHIFGLLGRTAIGRRTGGAWWRFFSFITTRVGATWWGFLSFVSTRVRATWWTSVRNYLK